jgi:hypothetical protein
MLRHWRGEDSLGIAYWRNSVLFANAAPTALLMFYRSIDPFANQVQWESIVALLLEPLLLLIWLWGIVGAMRSANRHTSRGGSLFWANAARLVICIAIISVPVRAYLSTYPQLKLLAALAAGHDPMPRVWVYIVESGKTLWLQGTLGEGSAEEVRHALATNPQLTTVMLSSRGGRVGEANQIAQMIRQRKLDTTVRGSCLSACTHVLLAGEHRSATESAKIGFHRSTLPGLTTMDEFYLSHRMFIYYRSLGLPSTFVAKVIETPPQSMWYPTQEELLEARVLGGPASGAIIAPLELNISSVRLVDYHDQPEIPAPRTVESQELDGTTRADLGFATKSSSSADRPHRLVLRIEFGSAADLQSIANRNAGISSHAYICSHEDQVAVLGGPTVYRNGKAVRTDDTTHSSDQHAAVEDAMYYIFLNISGVSNRESIPKQIGFDLKARPEEICFQVTGSGASGLIYTSGIATVSKQAIVAAFDQLGLH